MFIDSHAHLTTQDGLSLEDELLRAKQAQVVAIINICTDLSSLEKGLQLEASCRLRKDVPRIYTVASTTPHDVAKDGAHFYPFVEKAAFEKKLVAIGETGLDYYYEHSPKDEQKKYLRKYLQLAQRFNLPVVIHCRDAWSDFFSILDEENAHAGKKIRGVLHCFTGSLEDAKQVIARGFYLSLSGIVTFKKSQVLQEVAKYVPLDRVLIETDSPYLAPQAHRGKKNEPAYVVEVAKTVASLKGISIGELSFATHFNTSELFNLGQ